MEASKIVHFAAGGMKTTRRKIASAVSAILIGDENRLGAHPAERADGGGGRRARFDRNELGGGGGRIAHRFLQLRFFVVPIQKRRGQQRQRLVNRDGDADNHERLPGLVERNARPNIDDIGIADGHRERRVFGEIKKLADGGRNDDAHRLRNHDQLQRRQAVQAQRARGFGLPVRDGGDAAAHIFGDERGRVNRQREPQNESAEREFNAAVVVEFFEFGQLERNRARRPPDSESDGGENDDKQNRDGRRRKISAGFVLPPPRPFAHINNRTPRPKPAPRRTKSRRWNRKSGAANKARVCSKKRLRQNSNFRARAAKWREKRRNTKTKVAAKAACCETLRYSRRRGGRRANSATSAKRR